MAFFSEQRLNNRIRDEFVKGYNGFETGGKLFSKAKSILRESLEFQESTSGKRKTYDIFLSHSLKDAKKIAGLRLELEDLGYSIYVDWIEDPHLDRSKVSKATAFLLRERMKNCRSLLYAFSENSVESKWMPWELGYFDGIKTKVAILPISDKKGNNFKGTEYLGIYYYVTVGYSRKTDNEYLWIRESEKKYVRYDYWLNNDKQPYIH